VAEVLSRLRAGTADEVPPFEALLEVPVRGGAPLDPRLMTIYRRRGEERSRGEEQRRKGV
jgi:hypothetical protein